MTYPNEDEVNSQEEAGNSEREGVNSQGQAARSPSEGVNSQRQADDARRSRNLESDSNYGQLLGNPHSIADPYEVNDNASQQCPQNVARSNIVTVFYQERIENPYNVAWTQAARNILNEHSTQSPPSALQPRTSPPSGTEIQNSTLKAPTRQLSKIELPEQEHSSPRKRLLEPSKDSPSKIPPSQENSLQLATPGPSASRANSRPQAGTFIPVVTISGGENLQERLKLIMQAPSPSPLKPIMVPRLPTSPSASQNPRPSTSGTESRTNPPAGAGRKVVITTKELSRELRNIIELKSPLPERGVPTTVREPQPDQPRSARRVDPSPLPRREPPRVPIPRLIITPPLQRTDNMLQTYIAPKRFQHLYKISRCLHSIRMNGMGISQGCLKYELPPLTVYLHSRLDGYKPDSAQNWSPQRIDQKIEAVQTRTTPLEVVVKQCDLHKTTIASKFIRLGIGAEAMPVIWNDAAIVGCLQDIKNRQAKLCSKSSYYDRILKTERRSDSENPLD